MELVEPVLHLWRSLVSRVDLTRLASSRQLASSQVESTHEKGGNHNTLQVL